MLRIERTLQTLKNWIENTIDVVEKVEIAKGDYKSPAEARQSPLIEGVMLPWFVHTKDERYFIVFNLEMPICEIGYDYLIEISTGREGEWDAVNPQLLAYVNGEIITGLDVNHRSIYVRSDWYGKCLEIGLHLYTGMAEGDIRFRAKLVKRNQVVNKAFHDLRVIKEVLESLPENSEAVPFIKNTVLDIIYDLRLDDIKSQGTLMAIKHLSQQLEEKVYGKTTLMKDFTVHAVGHTHIDVAWLWDLKQTSEKVVRSFSTALDLQQRFPEYRFMTSQPVLLEMLEVKQPSVYAKVKEGIRQNLWEVEGAMYLEADCNLIGGEAMIRQIEMGQAYFSSKFGKPSKTLWLPDVFGYSAALPQILKSFGIELFVTSKISWNDITTLPYDSFRWSGIDGSEIPTQFITTTSMESLKRGDHKTIYEGNCNATEVLGSVLRHQQRQIQPNVIMPFGFGDGGGGANEHMLENARRLAKGIPGMPTMKMSHVSDFIEAFYQTSLEKLPKWQGELYLEYHRGTYTTNTGIKLWHRTLENQLISAERLQSVLAVKGYNQPFDLQEEWKILLLNEFHDILPGTSIGRVYEEAFAQLKAASESVTGKVEALLSPFKTPVEEKAILFNPHGHEYSGILKFKNDTDEEIKSLIIDEMHFPVQCILEGYYLVALSQINPMSIRNVMLAKTFAPREDSKKAVINPHMFTTPFYDVKIDQMGRIISLVDRNQKRELIREGGFGNRLAFYEDRPLRWDAWDINRDYTKFEILQEMPPEIRLIEDGVLALSIEINYRFRMSNITQTLIFYKTNPRIDFETSVDWHEKQVLLKSLFDFEIHATEVKYDIQFGHVKRPVDENNPSNAAMFEVCAAHWGDLSEDDYGVTLMSNDKFGYSYLDSTFGLTLLKSPTWPDEASDQGQHHFCYAILPHEGDLTRGKVHQNAINFAIPIMLKTGFEVPEEMVQSMIKNLPENLVIESARLLDKNVIEVRLVEHFNRRGKALVQFSETLNKLEKKALNGDFLGQCPKYEDGFEISFKPFEIITLKMSLELDL